MNRKIGWRQCMRELLKFVRPYKGKFLVGLGAIVLATGLYAINPMMQRGS